MYLVLVHNCNRHDIRITMNISRYFGNLDSQYIGHSSALFEVQKTNKPQEHVATTSDRDAVELLRNRSRFTSVLRDVAYLDRTPGLRKKHARTLVILDHAAVGGVRHTRVIHSWYSDDVFSQILADCKITHSVVP